MLDTHLAPFTQRAADSVLDLPPDTSMTSQTGWIGAATAPRSYK